MGPQNGIVGDEFGTDLPETQVDERELKEAEKVSKYSRSHEYKKLKASWEATIERYKTHLPDGRPVTMNDLDLEELGRRWIVANTIIAELTSVMNYYENADQTIEGVDV